MSNSFGFQGGGGSGSSIPTLNFGLFSQILQSQIVTNTNLLESIVGVGIGTLSVPANTFVKGDSFHAVLGGELTCQNNTDITLDIVSGSTILATSGILRLGASTNRSWRLLMDFTIREIGGTGTASIVTNGGFTYSRNNTNGFEGINFNSLNNTTFDTTIINTLDIKVQWAVASPSSSIHSDVLVLTKTF